MNERYLWSFGRVVISEVNGDLELSSFVWRASLQCKDPSAYRSVNGDFPDGVLVVGRGDRNSFDRVLSQVAVFLRYEPGQDTLLILAAAIFNDLKIWKSLYL